MEYKCSINLTGGKRHQCLNCSFRMPANLEAVAFEMGWMLHDGYSLTQAAEELEVSIETIRNWKLAKKMPSKRALTRIMEWIGKKQFRYVPDVCKRELERKTGK